MHIACLLRTKYEKRNERSAQCNDHDSEQKMLRTVEAKQCERDVDDDGDDGNSGTYYCCHVALWNAQYC